MKGKCSVCDGPILRRQRTETYSGGIAHSECARKGRMAKAIGFGQSRRGKLAAERKPNIEHREVEGGGCGDEETETEWKGHQALSTLQEKGVQREVHPLWLSRESEKRVTTGEGMGADFFRRPHQLVGKEKKEKKEKIQVVVKKNFKKK